MHNKISLIAVGGATATGKSALAVQLAKKLNGEIVSSDSMQIYRKMNIGTAKPTEKEKDGVAHHMIDVCSPSDNYSSADWVEEACRAIDSIISRGKLPIVCGGTGMYLDALLRPEHFSEARENDELRASILAYAEEHGRKALHDRLRNVDPESADAIHPNNVKRVVRAIEIYESTGKTKTEHDRESILGDSRFNARIVTVNYENRNILYSRIDERVEKMINCGLLEEVKTLFLSGLLKENSTAAQAIGYKEIALYLRGEISFEDAVDMIKKNTRRYAKRQITWFSRYKDISVVPDRGGVMRTSEELAGEVIEKLGDSFSYVPGNAK